MVRAFDSRLKTSRVQVPTVLLSVNNLGQVVHTHGTLYLSQLKQPYPVLKSHTVAQ